ncbi:MAG: DUF58 domain-containing protein [Gemmataceae bacterium]
MLPRSVVQQLRRWRIPLRRRIRTLALGQYAAAFKGQGLLFDDVREYLPGDDIRGIDWNVTARLGTPFLKRFIEERERTLLLVVDRSPSMATTSTSTPKSTVALELAAILALVAVAQQDRVGLLAFSHRVERELPPRPGHRHALRLIRELQRPAEPTGEGTSLAAALERLAQKFRRRAIIIILSDFATPWPRPLFGRLAARHEVFCLRIADAHDAQLPVRGFLTIEDPETGAQRTLDPAAPGFAELLRERAAKDQKQFDGLVQSAGAVSIAIGTEGNHAEELLAGLARP